MASGTSDDLRESLINFPLASVVTQEVGGTQCSRLLLFGNASLLV